MNATPLWKPDFAPQFHSLRLLRQFGGSFLRAFYIKSVDFVPGLLTECENLLSGD